MPITRFPDPRFTGPEGLVAVGGDLHPDSLRLAYRSGIFPWPVEGEDELLWFCPPSRAVLVFDELHVPRSLAKARRRAEAEGPGRLSFTFDRAFGSVIRACAGALRKGQDGTWIRPDMIDAYVELHRLGHAHSVEAWDAAGELVAGAYGVDAGGAFAGESMFTRRDDASKLALLFLVEHLRGRGASFMDIQMLTPHLEALGAREIPRDEFLDRLGAELGRGLRLF